jgi:hypothetical protein
VDPEEMVASSTASPLQVLVQTVIALRLEEPTEFSVVGVVALVLRALWAVVGKVAVHRARQVLLPHRRRTTQVVAVQEVLPQA